MAGVDEQPNVEGALAEDADGVGCPPADFEHVLRHPSFRAFLLANQLSEENYLAGHCCGSTLGAAGSLLSTARRCSHCAAPPL